jgi:Tol biopolymer transport system component
MMSLKTMFLLSLVFTLLLIACRNQKDMTPTALYSVDANGNNQTIILSDSVNNYWGPAWSPDGTQLVFSIWTEGSDDTPLFLANADGSGLTQLTQNGRQNYLPAWSPDGMTISFISQTGETSTAEIFTINVDGTNETQLTDNDAFEYGTSWSRDGETIVFGSEGGGAWQIYTMDSDGNNQRPMDIPVHGNAPVWSPDGLKIAFTSDRDGDDDIWVMNVDGSDQKNLTQNDAWDDQPQWSLDGTSIVFTSDRAGTPNIFVIAVDGSEVRPLIEDSRLDMAFPSWSPDGSRLLFHATSAKE